ncbi:MAG: serine/threonine protein kinase [Anaerolineae bacterium]|nr:serine/threonine protein kinase [Anaerolineae bacterium]
MVVAPLEGQMLGKYRVLEPLGRGGMARVYRAYHSQLDRYVAIKVLRSDLVEDAEFLSRFRREARAVAALRHSNIVQVFDSDVEGEIYYIVLELLEGDTLKTRLNDYRVRGEHMPLGEIVRVMLDVLEGLAYAHGEGMVHRDLKPANILLTKRGEAVITDFGIAQIVGSTQQTASGALMGTLNYMAPEQGLEGQSDVRSDIYSLGIMLYEMLTQQVPFDADTPLAVLMKHLNDPLPLPRQIEPDIPEPFERIVLKALSKRPVDRYDSAEEMTQMLWAAAEEAGVEVPQRISLPLSFTTSEAPSESVAVFSGTSRERITDAEFAVDDTDASIGQRLMAAGAEGTQNLRDAGKDFLGALGAVAHLALTKTTEAIRQATDATTDALREKADAVKGEEPEGVLTAMPEAPEAPQPPMAPDAEMGDEGEGQRVGLSAVEGATDEKAWRRAKREKHKHARREERKRGGGGAGLAVLGAIGIVFIGNSCMLSIAVPLDFWDIFEYGWPIELFLVTLALFGIMYVTSSIWMLIPSGIIFGTGVLMMYSSLTNDWDQWVFLWICQAWVLILSIFVPVWLARNRRLAGGLSRLIAIVGGLLSLGLIVGTGALIGVGSLVGDLVQMLGF